MPVDKVTIVATACVKKLMAQNVPMRDIGKIVNACLVNPRNTPGMVKYLEYIIN